MRPPRRGGGEPYPAIYRVRFPSLSTSDSKDFSRYRCGWATHLFFSEIGSLAGAKRFPMPHCGHIPQPLLYVHWEVSVRGAKAPGHNVE
jgi:hypothetical protein